MNCSKCGACEMRPVPYKQQLTIKHNRLNTLLSQYGTVLPVIGMDDPANYRGKVHRALAYDKRNGLLAGIYEKGTHNIIRVDNCIVEDSHCQEIADTVCGLIKSFKFKIYDEDTGYGDLRHILVRRSFSTGEVMVVLVSARPFLPSSANFVKALREKHGDVSTVVLNINDRGTNIVLGQRDKVLFGSGYITEKICGCSFRLSASSFFQVNPVQTEILYRTAIDAAGLTGKETVFDAYCGTGTIGLIASSGAKEVISVEQNPAAVKDAIANAKDNGIQNDRFYKDDAAEFLSSLDKNEVKFDVVFMDPPRQGSSTEFLTALCYHSPAKIVYISCGPESLARDLAILTKSGYHASLIQPVDMFPYTEHVETVVLLSGEKVDGHIDIDLDAESLKNKEKQKP